MFSRQGPNFLTEKNSLLKWRKAVVATEGVFVEVRICEDTIVNLLPPRCLGRDSVVGAEV
jgi:hypothetical protein